MSLRTLQKNFLKQLLSSDPDQSTDLSFIKANEVNISTPKRFAVYENAYIVRQREVLKTDYEVSSQILGADKFKKMFYEFITEIPSTHTNISYFGLFWPDYLKKNIKQWDLSEAFIELTEFELFQTYSWYSAYKAEKQNPEFAPGIKVHSSVYLKKFNYSVMDMAEQKKLLKTNTVFMLFHTSDAIYFEEIKEENFNILTHLKQGHDLEDTLLKHSTHSPEQISELFSEWTQDGVIETTPQF